MVPEISKIATTFPSASLAPPRLPLRMSSYHTTWASVPINLEDQTSPGIQQRRRESEAATSERLLRMPDASGEVEVEGMTGLASSSSTPMGRPVTYYHICCHLVHRDWRDGAGLRRPSSCVGSPSSLRVRGAGLGTCNARVRSVPSTPSYRHSVVFRGGL
ncbi:hypothetical protein EV421DRAFT_1440638 [Armillaria borealis]|uniref:Uncharacterized protein n=1 Tax=Armillaria borealis TaxID=47425 RepID=A0AA39J0T1_9AGAR|nr:hypothetical protein EV421DRAFT_1440638 [Armillaria borealis]